MITRNELNFSNYKQSLKLQKLDFVCKLLVTAITNIKSSKTAYKLEFFDRMLNFIRVVGLKVLATNKHVELAQITPANLYKTNYKIRVTNSLLEFLYNFELITIKGDKQAANKNYDQLLNSDSLDKLFNKNYESMNFSSLNKAEKKLVDDFMFISDLIQFDENHKNSLTHPVKHKKVWESMVKAKNLDYEIRLCKTLYNLIYLTIPEKIKSPFEENFYTESGQNAFKNFTRFRFIDFFRKVIPQNNPRVFDLGCGYGNYINAVNTIVPDCTITGIEMNPSVFNDTKQKFESAKNIDIINKDFFDYTPVKKFDAILINYVLFYFNAADKIKLLKKAKNMLTENGSIILCQYISGIENLKKELARKQKDISISKKIEMFYSDKILYANTLWNDAVDTFSEAVKWDELNTMLSELGLRIESMTHADKFYYSLFIEIKSTGANRKKSE